MKFCITMLLFCCALTIVAQESPVQKFGKIKPTDFEKKIYPIDSSASAVVLFDVGSAQLRPGFQEILETRIADRLAEIVRDFDVDVIEDARPDQVDLAADLAPRHEASVARIHRLVAIVPENGRLLDTSGAVIAGLTYNFLPFMVLPLYASLEKIDGRLVEAASDLYASPSRGFLKVTLPLSMPGVVAGTLLTFIPAAGDYINAQLLGSTNQRMVGNVIQDLFTDTGDYAAAGALSVTLMAIIVALVVIYIRKAGTEELL